MFVRSLVTITLACFALATASPAAADKKDDKWVPPGLSHEEKAEWKNGRPPGWSQGQKKGWRGRSCPPGQAKKGRCPDAPGTASLSQPNAPLTPLQQAIERIREWGRARKLAPGTLDAMLFGLQGAVDRGVPVPTAERFVISAADRSVPPNGIEVLTRALAYGVQRGAAPDHLQQFADHGLSRGVPADAIALGLYRMGADARR